MDKIRLTTTQRAIKAASPCASGWAMLLKSLPSDYPQDKPINLLHILKSNSVQDMMWALRAATPCTPKLRVAMCADMAERVLKIYEAKCPRDKRPRDCIKACRQFVRGKITFKQLKAAAAADAGYAAADAADAAYAAYAAAAAAADADAAADAGYAAAAYAAYAAYAAAADAGYDADAGYAAAVAADAAERKAQARIIRQYLK